MNQFREGIIGIDLLLTVYVPDSSASMRMKKSFPQLKKLLDEKNKRLNYPANIIQRAAFELDKHRMYDHRKIDQAQLQYKQRSAKQTDKKQHPSIFDKQLSLNNIDDYIDAKIDQCRVSNIQFLMSQTNVNQKFKVRILERMSQRNDRGVAGASPATRATKNAYHICMRNYLKTFSSATVLELVKALYSATGNQLWRILEDQLEGSEEILDNGGSGDLKVLIKDNTLRILEKKFAQTLPMEYRLDQYFSDFMANKATKPFTSKFRSYSDKNGRPVWALSYLLLRAGKIQALMKFLQDENDEYCSRLAKDLDRYFQQNKVTREQFVWRHHNVTDTYLQQIFSIMNGVPVSDPTLVAKPLDFIWFGLKTCTLSTKVKDCEFNITELQKYIQNVYNKDAHNKQSTELLFYSLNYDYLLQSRNSLIDRDQKIHLAIVFDLARFSKHDLIHTANYERQLLKYANEMLVYGIDVAVDYIGLQPNPAAMVRALQELLIGNDRVEEFFGFGYGNENPFKRFGQVLDMIGDQGDVKSMFGEIAEKYARGSHRYATPAKIMMKFLHKNQQGLKYMIRGLLEALGNPTVSQKEISELNALLQALKADPIGLRQISPDHRNILKFIDQFRALQKANNSKIFKQIQSALQSSMFNISQTGRISYEFKNIIDQLMKLNQISVLFTYIQLSVKANDIYFTYLSAEQKTEYYASIQKQYKSFEQVITYLENIPGLKMTPIEKQMMENVSLEISRKFMNANSRQM